ncbi:protein translocase subunit SecDF [Pedobacter deserti]|uniref:protein translocase subunit SecDF n=1 Tax=Pedobacter deserti TaxID=2817382 RepID=UPI00210A7495|nr:protein translocase subunit SecDF [Pedobacter sp. SYSU D00382]
MQGKGFIKLMAILLGIVCVYSLSFSFVTSKVEKDAKAYAKGDVNKERAYLDSMATVPVYPILGFNYQFCKEKEINLGLDLKGGMNVTMEISVANLIKSLANNTDDANFNQAIENAQRQTGASGKDFIAAFVNEFEKISPNGKLADYFANESNAATVKANATNAEIKNFLTKEADNAIDRSFIILRSRIDGFGVVSPNMQKQEGTNRILIELPGVDESAKQRVRKLLSGSAELQFWHVYNNEEVFPIMENINNTLAASLKNAKDTSGTATADTASKGGSKLAGLAKGAKQSDSTALQAQEMAKTNPLFSVLNIPTYQAENGQQQLAPGAVVGRVLQKDTAKVNEFFARPEIAAIIPQTYKFLWSVKPINDTKIFELYAIKVTSSDGRPDLGGDAVSNARDDYDPQSGKPVVTMYMTGVGASTWKKMTGEAAANGKKSIAIVLDDQVYSAPSVNEEIPNGVSSISGSFTVEETKDLANVLKAGKLPVPAHIVGEYVVGPTLGQESIDAGLISSILGLVLVLGFMAIYYSKAGWVANIALVTNLFFLIGAMTSLGAVWTLPGIAGLVLTIGMAVDANVLIYERIKEELAAGKAVRQAIADGYKNAYSAIIDSNIVTLITGIILFYLGTGPIKGFATTLVLGIVTSLFTSIFITRLVFEALLKKEGKISFSIPLTANLFKDSNFNFVSGRRKFYIFSSVIILAGIVSIFTKGFSLGVDFQGGRAYVVEFKKDVNTIDVRDALDEKFGQAPEVKTYGIGNQVRITTSYLIDETGENVESQVEQKLNTGLKSLNNPYLIKDAQKIGPTMASDIKTSAVYAVLLAILAVFIYIVIRFKNLQFGIAAVIALLHDVLVLLAIFSIFNGILPFSLDIDQQFIAAILTVMGYSMNDTVVVFDRVREYLGQSRHKNESMPTIVNNALNSTLNRTVVTGLCVMLALLVLFFFGGDILRGFSFAMLIGVIFGTYSSLFVATPFVVEFTRKKEDNTTV